MQNYKRTSEKEEDGLKPMIFNYMLKDENFNKNTNDISELVATPKSLQIDHINDNEIKVENKSIKPKNDNPEIILAENTNKSSAQQNSKLGSLSFNTMVSVNKFNLKCPFCNEKNYFTNKMSLLKHCKLNHGQTTSFYCNLCKLQLRGGIIKRFEHMTKKHPDKTNIDKVVAPKKSLKYKEYRKSNDPIPCPLCGVKVGNRTLYLHMNIKHLHPMKNKCNRCEETFTTYTQMVKHKSNFHGIGKKKNLLCNICGKKFECNSDLKYHVASVHENQRPHMCDFCGKAFKRLGDLNKHRLIHTGERPFQCNICNKTFNRSNSAKKHCINVHGLKITSRINSPFLGDNFPIKKNT